MNLGDFRTRFKARLNRSDCTDALALEFIDEGIKRVHRELRVRQMETVAATLTADASSRLTIPSDYLEMKGLWPADSTRRVIKQELDEFLRLGEGLIDYSSVISDVYFVRRGGYWYLFPDQSEGTEFTLDYIAKTALTTSDLATDNTFLDEHYDVFLYAALIAAANHFEDDREAKWETQYLDRVNTLNTLTVDQDLAEGVQTVQPGTSTEY
jgi:hypothetical protein